VADWDPSGLHMSQVDLSRRIEKHSGVIAFNRLALTIDDRLSSIPLFPVETKKLATATSGFGISTALLAGGPDALRPNVIRERVATAILGRLDGEARVRAKT
jgi:hypothetical protein